MAVNRAFVLLGLFVFSGFAVAQNGDEQAGQFTTTIALSVMEAMASAASMARKLPAAFAASKIPLWPS